MPPVRTAKKTKSSAKTNPVARRQPKSTAVAKGLKKTYFGDDRHDWDDVYSDIIGTSTKEVKFGYGFVLTDSHIDQILALGSKTCQSLTHFIFEWGDVSYDAHNSAQDLTAAAAVRLAKACPNLKVVQLKDTDKLADEALLAFFEFCPKLTSLEISGGLRSGADISGAAFDGLREREDWAPKLKKLILEKHSLSQSMKPMRALGRSRPNLTVTLVSRSEQKKWGDWEMTQISENYKKGRIRSTW